MMKPVLPLLDPMPRLSASRRHAHEGERLGQRLRHQAGQATAVISAKTGTQ